MARSAQELPWISSHTLSENKHFNLAMGCHELGGIHSPSIPILGRDQGLISGDDSVEEAPQCHDLMTVGTACRPWHRSGSPNVLIEWNLVKHFLMSLHQILLKCFWYQIKTMRNRVKLSCFVCNRPLLKVIAWEFQSGSLTSAQAQAPKSRAPRPDCSHARSITWKCIWRRESRRHTSPRENKNTQQSTWQAKWGQIGPNWLKRIDFFSLLISDRFGFQEPRDNNLQACRYPQVKGWQPDYVSKPMSIWHGR